MFAGRPKNYSYATGRITAIAKCGLLLQTYEVAWSVWQPVCDREPYKNGWTDRNAVWDVDLWGDRNHAPLSSMARSCFNRGILGHAQAYLAVDILKVTHKGTARGDATCLPPRQLVIFVRRFTRSAGLSSRLSIFGCKMDTPEQPTDWSHRRLQCPTTCILKTLL